MGIVVMKGVLELKAQCISKWLIADEGACFFLVEFLE